MADMPKYKLTTVTTASPASLASNRLIAFVVVGGSDASGVEFKNAVTDTGTVLMSAKTAAATTYDVCFDDLGGVAFSTGIFCKPSGTGAIVYAWTA
jgi:hypothetical protein